MVFTQITQDNEAQLPTDIHTLQAWMELRGDTFENQLHLIVNMAFQMGPCGITATQVRQAIANTPGVAHRWGVSSPAARLSSAKKHGLLVKVNTPGEREGRYVHIAYLQDEEE